jgi:predicted esterase
LKQNSDPIPPLFQAHGIPDNLVLYDWGKATSDKLLELGVNGQFHTYPDMGHEPGREELMLLKQWICKLLPPI